MKYLLIITLSFMSLFASVDINKASVKELTSLKGIGSFKAQLIVKYREKVKCFKSLDELTKVKGIGEAILDKNKENLKLGECKR